MAFAPCTLCAQPYRGASSAFYAALVNGADRFSVKHKVCVSCAERLAEWANQHLSLVSEGLAFYPQTKPVECLLDGAELGEDRQAFFLNEYRAKREDRQLYGQVCFTHSTDVAAIWGIEP